MAKTLPLMCDHPVLSEATLNYNGGCRYRADHQRQAGSQIVTHTVTADRCLVADLLKAGHAQAICTVVAPWAMYRKTCRAEDNPRTNSGELQVVQKINLKTDAFEPPFKMHPSIVVVEPPPPLTLGPEHGVDEAWHGAEIAFAKGDILTDHPWWEMMWDEQILKISEAREGELEEGSYEVSLVSDSGFYFAMRAAPDLFEAMRRPPSDAAALHVNSLQAAALGEALRLLKEKKYEDPSEWRPYANLKSLHAWIRKNGMPTWDEESDTEFRPNQIVAKVAPHVIHQEQEDLFTEEADS